MIVWNTLTIANTAGSVTLTPSSSQLISSQCIRAPEFRAHGSDGLYGYLTSHLLQLGGGAGSNSCVINKDGIQIGPNPFDASTLSATELKVPQVTANNITVNNTITAASANITSSLTAAVNKLTCQMPDRGAGAKDFIDFLNPSSLGTNGSMKLGNDNSAQLYLTASNIRVTVPTLNITESLKYDGVNFPKVTTYSTSASDDDYKITLRYRAVNVDIFSPDNSSVAEESGVLTIVSFFNRVYDIYFTVGKGGQIAAAGHTKDAWWFIEAPTELQTLMQASTIIDMEAREYEHYEYTGLNKTLEGFKSQWQLSYFTIANKYYLGLGFDSNTSANNCISAIGHIRLIAN